MHKASVSAALVSLALIPQLSFAATPQQTLDAVIKNGFRRASPLASTVDFHVNVQHVPVNKSDQPQSGSFQVVVDSQSYSRGGSHEDANVRVRFPKISLGNVKGGMYALPLNLNNPFVVEVRAVADRVYAQLSQPSNEVLAALTANHMDTVATYFNRWVYLDLQELTREVSAFVPGGSTLTMPDRSKPQTQLEKDLLSGKLKLLQVTGVEKDRVVDGKLVQRMRVRLHPTLWTYYERNEMEHFKKTYETLRLMNRAAYARMEREERVRVRKQLVDLQRVLTRLRMVVVVNITDQAVTRFELAGQWNEPNYTTDSVYSQRLRRWVTNKKLTAHERITVQGVGTTRFIPDARVAVPEGAQSVIDLFKSSDTDMPSGNTSSTGGLTAGDLGVEPAR